MGSFFRVRSHRSVREVEGLPVQNDGTIAVEDDKVAARIVMNHRDDFALVESDSPEIRRLAKGPSAPAPTPEGESSGDEPTKKTGKK